MKKHFQINQRDGLVHCFAHCGISGTFSHAIEMIEGCNAKQAQRIVLRHATVGVRTRRNNSRHRAKTADTRTDAIIPDLSFSSYIPSAGLEYLSGRGINGASIAAWELGWDDRELRIVIPAKDERSQLRFLIRRAVKKNDNPKYLYSEGYPKTSLLFGACQTDQGMIRSKGLILVEGSLDVIRLHQNGFKNTCAILGTGISKQQVQIISNMRPKRIWLMFDKDTAGVRNIEICKTKLYKYPLFVCKYPRGKGDPAEMTREEIIRSVDRAVSVHRFFQDLKRLDRRVSVG